MALPTLGARLACALVVLVASAASGALRVGPAAGVLWSEDFTSFERSDALTERGWLVTGRSELSPTAAGVALRARGPAFGAGFTRLVPYDLETAETRGIFPYLVLDLAAVEESLFAGLGLRGEARRPGRVLIDAADQPGRYVFDLRRHLPELDGHRGLFPLSLLLGGATQELPGPRATLRSLSCVAEPPARLELDLTSPDARLRRGGRLTITARLSEPAEAVAVELRRSGPPATPFLLNGAAELELFPADDSGLVWSWTVTVGEGTTTLTAPGSELVLRARPAGQVPFATTAWFDLATGDAAPERRAVAPARPPSVPRVDGLLDDEAWRLAPANALTEPEAPALPASFRVIAGDDGLYFGLVARGNAERDRFAVTLSPADDPAAALRFEIDPAGVATAERQREGQAVAGWETEWRAAAGRGEQGWSAELVLPWAALELGTGSAPSWGLQVARSSASGTYTWAPPHAPAPGALLALPSLEAYRYTSSEPRFETRPAPDGLEIELRLTVTNLTTRPQQVTAKAGAFLGDGRVITAAQRLTLAPKEPRLVSFDLPVPAAGSYRVAWQLTAAAPPELRLAGRRQVEAVLRPLTARWLLAPGELAVEVTPAAWLPPGSRVVAELHRGDQLVAAQSANSGREPLLMKFDLVERPADCRLVLTARHGERRLGELSLPLPRG